MNLSNNAKERQKALTAQRLKRFGSDKEMNVSNHYEADHQIQSHFYDRLSKFDTLDQDQVKKEENAIFKILNNSSKKVSYD